VSEKIKKWHEDIHLKKKGEFQHDSDFVNIISSPNDFSDDCIDSTSEDPSDEPLLELETHSTIGAKKRFGLKPIK